MSEQLKSIGFAVILCLVCSLLLTAAATGLRERQQRNILLDKHKNILKSVGLIDSGQTYSARQITDLYENKIKSVKVDEAGTILPENTPSSKGLSIYFYMENDQVAAYIIPIDTRGLWGPIGGYLAIENDGSTVAGFTVYKHSETPGLGGEIESRWFQKNFKGKKIINRQGEFASIKVAKGQVAGTVPPNKRPNYVDGISGATLTGKYLTAGLKKILAEYEPVSIRFRKNKQ